MWKSSPCDHVMSLLWMPIKLVAADTNGVHDYPWLWHAVWLAKRQQDVHVNQQAGWIVSNICQQLQYRSKTRKWWQCFNWNRLFAIIIDLKLTNWIRSFLQTFSFRFVSFHKEYYSVDIPCYHATSSNVLKSSSWKLNSTYFSIIALSKSVWTF